MKNHLLLIAIWLVLMMTAQKANAQQAIKGDFVHAVYFWLKNPDNQEDKKAFEASLKKFIDVSQYIKSRHLGTPAATSRPVIDNSYTYCLVVTFDSKKQQDQYQEEPAHKRFIEESKDLWEKVLVYDSENIW